MQMKRDMYMGMRIRMETEMDIDRKWNGTEWRYIHM